MSDDQPKPPPTTEAPREPIPDLTPDDPSAETDGDGRSGRLYRFTRRLLDRRELGEDAKILLGSVLETTDHAKTEAVRLVAREVRNYLDELQWKEDLRDLLTGHSLKVNAEFTLIPHDAKAKATAAANPRAKADPKAKSDPDPADDKE